MNDYWKKLYSCENIGATRFGTVCEYAADLTTQKRAGIILYYSTAENLFFAAGIDYMTHEITDFGGHVEKNDRSIIDTAIREFNEETKGLFRDYVDRERIYECPAIFNNMVIIIFVRIPDIDEFKRRLEEASPFDRKAEIRSIIFFRREFCQGPQPVSFFPLIRDMMQQALRENIILYTLA